MALPTLLISKSDFAGYVDLSPNMADEKINPLILQAQEFDLPNLLGKKFYYDMLSVGVTNPPYANFWNGTTYTIDGIPIPYEGFKPVLVFFAAARIIKQLDMHFTPNAMMQKRNEFSDPMSGSDKSYNANQYQNIAIAYFDKSKLFLDANSADFQYWNVECCNDHGQQFRPRMKSVGYRGKDRCCGR